MQRKPRVKNNKHLDFIRGLPCLVCGDNTSTEAAHIRMADRRVAKRHSGIAEKPDDKFTVPLCGRCHREQHTADEMMFWKRLEIDPILIALALYGCDGDQEIGEAIIRCN